MIYRTLMRMAKDIAVVAIRLVITAGAVILIFVTIGAVTTALGAKTGLPTWALAIGRLMWALATAWGIHWWFMSAKKRAVKRNK